MAKICRKLFIQSSYACHLSQLMFPSDSVSFYHDLTFHIVALPYLEETP